MFETKDKAYLGVICLLFGAIISGAVFHSCSAAAADKKIVDLQNAVATRDKTIEIQRGMYTRLSVQVTDSLSALDKKDRQVQDLTSQLKKKGEDVLVAQTMALNFKKAYEQAVADHTKQEPVLVDGKETRTKVTFDKDFGYLSVSGHTLTNPAEAIVSLKQNRPLKLNVAVTQAKDKSWHAYVTSSEEDISVDVVASAVSPQILAPKWYENIGITTGIGIGTNSAGLGALVSLGVNYRFRQFSLGPQFWLGINKNVDKFFGVSFEWRPFQKTQ